MILQILLLSIPGWLFVLVSWIAGMLMFLLVLLYQENKRYKQVIEITRWGYVSVLEAAKRAYTKMNINSTAKWEQFLKDIESITKTVNNEGQGKK